MLKIKLLHRAKQFLKNPHQWILSCVIILSFVPFQSEAQSPPSAGSVLRQIENQQLNQENRLPDVSPEPARKESAIGGEAVRKISVKGFRFVGNHAINNETLQNFVKKYKDRELTVAEIQNIAAEIGELYRKEGYLAQALLPKQDVTEGIVTIQIIEAKFGGLKLITPQGQLFTNVKPEVVEGVVGNNLEQGTLLNLHTLDRSLLLADDMPGVSIQGAFEPGDQEGETRIEVKAWDKPWYAGDVTLNNYGAKSTGVNQAIANLSLASPTGHGDLLQITGMASQGTAYGRAAYSFPLGSGGWRLGANASTMGYRTIDNEFSLTAPKGSSTVAGMTAQYPVIRSQERNLYFNFEYNQKYFNNLALDSADSYTQTSNYRINVAYLSLYGNQYDDMLGGGVTNASLNYGVGNVGLASSPNYLADQLGYQTSGGYSRMRWSLNRNQTVMRDLSFFISGQGQFASGNMDSSEKFYLGGPYGVRAYPTNEGAGSQGVMINVELRHKLAESLMLTGFYDWGQITQNKNNMAGDASSILSSLNTYALSGYGLSVTWSGPYRSSLSAIWAHRVGGNPNPTSSGLDQNGSLDLNRFWLLASISF